MQTYSDRLRWAMAQVKPPISQAALAARVGVRHQSINYLCDPSRNARGSRYTDAIARALGVSAHWLATGEGKPHAAERPTLDQRQAAMECIRTARILLVQLEWLALALEDGSNG